MNWFNIQKGSVIYYVTILGFHIEHCVSIWRTPKRKVLLPAILNSCKYCKVNAFTIGAIKNVYA